MLIQELTLRVAETELINLAIYDSLRVVGRTFGPGQPESLMLIASRSVEPANEVMLGFLIDVKHALGAIDGVADALMSSQPVVDLRGVMRPATPQEATALEDTSAPPPGAERMTPAEAADFLKSKGADPASQGLEPTPIAPQAVKPAAHPIVARSVQQLS